MSAGDFKFLAGGGDLGNLIRHFNWANTPLGPIELWPQSLKTSVSLMLNSQHPVWIGWGADVTFLYNDAYIQVLGEAKHKWALGLPTVEVWPEIWDICGPLVEKVFQKGEGSYVHDVRFFMNRGDFFEETFFSFSYSPIRNESGDVGGLFCPSTEVTKNALNTRRLKTLSELAAKSLVEKTTEAACASAASILAENPDDIAFALIYLIDPGDQTAHLEQAIGLLRDDLYLAPPVIELTRTPREEQAWPIAAVASSAQMSIVPLNGVEGLPLGAAGQRVAEALVLPVSLHGRERPLGVLVAGLNPTRKLDLDYHKFIALVASHIATAIQNARAVEGEKRRADMLAELDRAKTTFFSNVSHELRTPLTLILGPLEDEIRESETPRERIRLAHRNSLRLLKLVNTLLHFSRIEAGRVEVCFEPTDIAGFTAELASVFRSGIEQAGLKLNVDCRPLSDSVYIDREMWEKIVFNLLSNALKYTAEGEIEVKLDEVEANGMRCARLAVRDTGVGIPAEDLPHVFERFRRVRNTWARSHEGTGIGLALVQELSRLHGGQAQVESVTGEGTTFTVSIPMGAAHLPKDRLGAARRTSPSNLSALPYMEEAKRWEPDNALAAATTSEVNEGAATNGHRLESGERPEGRILLADDNNDMRNYVLRLLTSQGYEVTAVADGQAALEAALERTPSLVLSDVMMPRLDGFTLLRELRKNPVTKAIPIVLLSARAGEEARIDGVEAGADDYLTKPFNARELLARVTTQLKLARMRKEAEDAIRQREERLRHVLTEKEQTGQALVESERRLIEVNSLLEDRAAHLEKVVQQRTAKLSETIGELEAFSYSIAHDLRAPLRSLQGFSEILLAEYGTKIDAEGQEFLSRIAKSASRMDTLIRDVLNYSQVVRSELRLEKIDVEQLIHGIVSTYPMFSSEKVEIIIEGSLPPVLANEAMLMQIFSNLMGNAIKFVRRGVKPVIRIWAESHGADVKFFVRDNGIGIAPDQHKKIFEIFQQVEKGAEGTGIGLAIVSKAVDRMGGKFGVDSVVGEGSTFWFSLRLP